MGREYSKPKEIQIASQKVKKKYFEKNLKKSQIQNLFPIC